MTLQDQLQRARRAARKQLRLWRRTHKRGHFRAWKKARIAVAKYERLVKAHKDKIAEYLEAGRPGWGGGTLIMANEVYPIMKRRGISPTSGKRTETFGNPSSDHYYRNLLAYAKDWATAENFAAAQEIRTALDPGGRHVDYEEFTIERYGHTFRVQIIAGTHGTGPHLHIGIKRVS